MKRVEHILLFLTLLFLPTQLGRHFWPQFSFIYSLPIDYLSPTLYFWDILVLGLVVIWKVNGGKIKGSALNLCLFFLLTVSISLFASQNSGAGFFRLEQYAIAGMFGVYLASQKWSEIKLKIFLPLSLAISLEAILAILQFFKGGTLGLWILGERTFSISTPAIAKFDFYGRQFLRPYATFPHPNVLATFMIIGVIILSWTQRYWIRPVVLAAILTVLFTASRVAILTGFVAALILLNKKLKIIILIAALIVSPALFTRYSALFSFDNLSVIRREELSEVAINMWLNSPLFGVGLNNFIPKAGDVLLVGPSRFLQPVHNIFLLTLSETGFVGLIGLISLIGYPILRLVKLFPKPYPLNPFLLIWGIILFLGLFDHYFLTLPQGYRMLFLVWGISFSMLELKRAKAS